MKITAIGTKTIAAVGLGLALTLTNTVSFAQERDTRTYEVSITNIMGAGQFTPVLAATHNRRTSVFTTGNPARVGLARLAETGDTSVLQNTLSNSANVGTVGTYTPEGSPLTVAGSTLEFTIEAPVTSRYLSLAAMILPTNDAFVGLDTVSLPTSGSTTILALGYDAGSEQNDEICANIPGPTCGGSGEFSGLNGEGFVYVSRGIQGIADLDSSEYDWRNPIARVTITRVN